MKAGELLKKVAYANVREKGLLSVCRLDGKRWIVAPLKDDYELFQDENEEIYIRVDQDVVNL